MEVYVSTATKYERYRLSEKGQAAAARRNARLRAARAARRAYRNARLYRACSFDFDFRYGGPITSGVPPLGELDLRAFIKGVQTRISKKVVQP
jgi:hypothetical protein